jgi:hypothetical protein
VISFIAGNTDFLRRFVESGGEIELILNGYVVDDDKKDGGEFRAKVFETTLYPDFLQALTVLPVAFKVQMWL